MKKKVIRPNPKDASEWYDLFIEAAVAVDTKPLDLYTAAVVYKAFLDQSERIL